MADMTIPRLSGDAVANYEDINAAFAAAEQHGHGAITRDGKVGTVSNMLLGTGVDGAIEAKTAQQAADILQRSNPNILHNWDWINPINQRGEQALTGKISYFIDRWIARGTSASIDFSIVSNGIRLASSGDGSVSFNQNLENGLNYAGKQFTFSASVVSVPVGTITLAFGDMGQNYYSPAIPSGFTGIYKFTFDVPEDAALDSIKLWLLPGSSVVVDRVKLESGQNSTLAYDLPMDWATELLKCQRFFQLCSTNNVASVDMRPLMRISNPTITGSGPYAYSADL